MLKVFATVTKLARPGYFDLFGAGLYLSLLRCMFHLSVFSKGVCSILHNGADSYNRCRLSLRADKLIVVLREGCGMSNELYANALKDEGDFDDGKGLCSVPSHVNTDEQPLNMFVDMPPLLPPETSCADLGALHREGPRRVVSQDLV